MTPPVALDGTSIKLTQKSIWKREYELVDGDKIIGMLAFPHVFTNQVDAESGEQRWILDTKGLWNPVATVRLPDTKKPLVTVSLKQSRGTYTLKLPRYRTLRLTTNIWKSEYVLKTSMNATLCTLKIQQFPRFGGDFTIGREVELLREYPWLLYLVAYIVLLAQSRHGAH